VRVRAFLEYIEALRDVGAREGEATAEAEGAVRLMTIHKSKGLEFPLVVLADAARQSMGGNSVAYSLAADREAHRCWAVAPDRLPAAPLLFRLAKHLDAQQGEAESARLLYVAMTRAKEKLLVSGHLTVKADGSWKTNGWLKALFEASGVDAARCISEPGTPYIHPLSGGGSWRLWLGQVEADLQPADLPERPVWPDSSDRSLIEPLNVPQWQAPAASVTEDQGWNIAHRPSPGLLVGSLVHEALCRWPHADGRQPEIDPFLHQLARQKGVEAGGELEECVRVCKILLARIRRHPLWDEIQQAEERYQAIPFHTGSGTLSIDLLVRAHNGWKLIDFHTSSLQGQAAVQAALELRRPGLLEKCRAVQTRLGAAPQVSVCFLDADHQVVVRILEF
jgi:ATP-dependent exoDNAse (exonuclease V) beta subunit